MLVTLLITPKYEATMSLIVSRSRIDPQITSSDKSVDVSQSAISDEEFNSELELLKSVDVVTSVVKALNLVEDNRPAVASSLDEWRMSVKNALRGRDLAAPSNSPADVDYALEKTVNQVSANLYTEPTKKSRIIKVSYYDTDPIRAKKTLEAIYQKFVELHVELNERGEAGQVFTAQTGKFDQKLDAATQNLKRFDAQNGVTGADISTQQRLLQQQLSDAQTQLSAARTSIGETSKRIDSLREKISAEPIQVQSGYVSKYVPAVDRMKDELTSLRQQRTQLLQKYQANSRFVRENQERIDQLERSLAAEAANPPQEKTFSLNEIRRKLESELYEAQGSLASLKAREKALTGQVEKLTSEVSFLNIKSIERIGLERERSLNEEAFLLYQKKARETEIGQILNKERILNFSVVDPPRTDGMVKTPRTLLNLGVLMLIGIIAGIGSTAIFDRNRTVRDLDIVGTPLQVESRLNIPLLAVIPQIELPKKIQPAVRGTIYSGDVSADDRWV